MYYATKTTNRSFIDMWRYLQRENIENNLFMLQTIDKDLVNFSIEKYMSMDREDPYFLAYKNKIIDEARHNIWFYFRELLFISDGNGEHRPFELNPTGMMMLYLYEKGKSFVNTDLVDGTLPLHFLWNYHKSIYNNDIILVNNINNINKISNDIKKYLAHMDCQVHFGSSQIISDESKRYIISDIYSFKDYYFKNDKNGNGEFYREVVRSAIKNKVYNNIGTDNNVSVFILETDMNILPYVYLDFNSDFNLYLNNTNDDTMCYNVLDDIYQSYEKASVFLYDYRDDIMNNNKFFII